MSFCVSCPDTIHPLWWVLVHLLWWSWTFFFPSLYPTFLSFKFLFLASNKKGCKISGMRETILSCMHSDIVRFLVIGVGKEAAEAVETYPLWNHCWVLYLRMTTSDFLLQIWSQGREGGRWLRNGWSTRWNTWWWVSSRSLRETKKKPKVGVNGLVQRGIVDMGWEQAEGLCMLCILCCVSDGESEAWGWLLTTSPVGACHT